MKTLWFSSPSTICHGSRPWHHWAQSWDRRTSTAGSAFSKCRNFTHYNCPRAREQSVPPDTRHHGGHVTSEDSFPVMRDLSLVMRKLQAEPDWGPFYKITDQHSSKMSRSWRTRKDWGTATNRRRWGDVTTKCSVGCWTGSLNRKRTSVKKLVESE